MSDAIEPTSRPASAGSTAPATAEPWWNTIRGSLQGQFGNTKELSKLLHNARQRTAGKITIVDSGTAENGASLMKTTSLDFASPSTREEHTELLHTLGENIPENITSRVVIAEDLSHERILQLSAGFRVNPRVFVQHLQNSGYVNGHYEDEDGRSKSPGNITRNFYSMRWYRPVYRNKIRASLDMDQLLLSNPARNKVHWKTTKEVASKGGLTRHIVNHQLSAKVNILRRGWSLALREEETQQPATGWEERATLWTRRIENCRLYLVLLDPLPLLEEQAMGHPARIRELQQDPENPWREAFQPQRLNTARPLGMLADGVVPPLLLRKRTTVAGDSEAGPTAPISQLTVNIRNRCLFQQYTHRCPEDDFLGANVNVTKSTGADYSAWLIADHTAGNYHHPLLTLFRMIHADTMDFIEVVNEALVEARERDLDDVLIQEQLQKWRQFISRLDREIPILARSFELFSRFIQELGDETDIVQRQLEKWIREVVGRLTWLEKQITKTNKGILASLSLADSKRNISEAHSVAKLTELAFFFIPLSFAASLLSMQVKELQDGAPLRVFFGLAFGFVLLAYLFRIVLRSRYLSTTKAKTMSKVRKTAGLGGNAAIPTSAFVKVAAGIASTKLKHQSTGFPPPKLPARSLVVDVKSYFKTSIRKSGYSLPLLLILGIVSIPVALLWKRHLPAGFKLAMTLLLYAIAAPSLWMLYGPDPAAIRKMLNRRSSVSLVDDSSTSYM